MNEAKDETIRMEELEQVGKEVEKTEEVFTEKECYNKKIIVKS